MLAFASDRQFVKEYAWWVKEVHWQLIATLTFERKVSDYEAEGIFSDFTNCLERMLKADVCYVCGSEKRFSGCGKPASGRHYHLLLTSAVPMRPAIVKFVWQSVTGNRNDDSGAKVEPYIFSKNGAEYVLKYAPEKDGDWKVRNLELFHPARGLLDLKARSRRHLRRHKAREKKFRMISSAQSC